MHWFALRTCTAGLKTPIVVFLILLLTAPGVYAQDPVADSANVIESVDAINALQTADSVYVIERGRPEVDTWDVLEFPFHVVQAPFWIVGKLVAGLMVAAESIDLKFGIRRLNVVSLYPQVMGQGKAAGTGIGLLIGTRARPQRVWGFARGGITVPGYWGLDLTLGYSGAEPRQIPGRPRGTATTRPPRSATASRFGVLGFVRTAYRAQDNYYGMGIDSRQEDRADYDLERDLVGGEAYFRINPQLTLDLDGRWERDQAGGGRDDDLPDVDDTFPGDQIPGFGRQENQTVFGGYLEWRTGAPHTTQRRNRWIDVGYHWNESSTEGAADFGHFSGSAGLEIPLARRRLSFFFALEYESVRPSGEGEISFYELPALGGKGQLPAFRAFRFRDRDLLVGKAEYRWRVWSEPRDTMWLDAALVLYGGTVAHDMGEEFSFRNVRESYGVNFSLISQENEIGRLEFANGDEGFRVTISFGATS